MLARVSIRSCEINSNLQTNFTSTFEVVDEGGSLSNLDVLEGEFCSIASSDTDAGTLLGINNFSKFEIDSVTAFVWTHLVEGKELKLHFGVLIVITN